MKREAMAPTSSRDAQGLTQRLVDGALRLRFEELPQDVRVVARDCLADWLACTFAALDEPVSRIVAETAQEEGGHPQATVLGRFWRASILQAALVNGATSHALDYDDVNLAVPGHMSAAIWPALLALAEQRASPGKEVIASFVAGYEFACRVGTLVEPAHYANGFHATATIGTLGAAVACARLAGLVPEQAQHAVGLAATQAAGLKAMFGSMAKPLHAGLASQAGLRSVLLAGKGLISRTDVLECRQGFAEVHGGDFHLGAAEDAPSQGFHLLRNLFKFHAACYSTHAAIEAVADLRREHQLAAASVKAIEVVAGEGCSICNIQQPATGLEAKFSLRACAAFALLGIDTSALETWGRVADSDVAAVLERVTVRLVPDMGLSDARVAILCSNGSTLQREHDCGEPLADKTEQSARIAAKFRALAAPALGGRERADAVLSAIEELEHQPHLSRLLAACRTPPQ